MGKMGPDTTGQLIRDTARGDVAAFASLYNDVAPLIYGMARRVVRDERIAEEITQDVLLTIWQQAGRFDEQAGTGRAWALTIAHRRAVDRVRSEQAARNRHDRYGRETEITPFDEVAETAQRSADHDAVAAALAELTTLQRQAVSLAYYGGHTYREVAQLLGIPLGTVKTRIRDGLIRLRGALQADEGLATTG